MRREKSLRVTTQFRLMKFCLPLVVVTEIPTWQEQVLEYEVSDVTCGAYSCLGP